VVVWLPGGLLSTERVGVGVVLTMIILGNSKVFHLWVNLIHRLTGVGFDCVKDLPYFCDFPHMSEKTPKDLWKSQKFLYSMA
jgi:hypothetical protein